MIIERNKYHKLQTKMSHLFIFFKCIPWKTYIDSSDIFYDIYYVRQSLSPMVYFLIMDEYEKSTLVESPDS